MTTHLSDFDLGVDLARRGFGRPVASEHGPECARGWDSYTPEDAQKEFRGNVLDTLSELWLAAYNLGFEDGVYGKAIAEPRDIKERLLELDLDISKLIMTPTAG